MFKLNTIYCKPKKNTKTYVFAPLIFNQSFFTSNIGVFEDFNII